MVVESWRGNMDISIGKYEFERLQIGAGKNARMGSSEAS
jgi:hypothetical protein